jgi:hypothetical protein
LVGAKELGRYIQKELRPFRNSFSGTQRRKNLVFESVFVSEAVWPELVCRRYPRVD